jgi:DNA integrity scanning protein DisA with diadenylate cyclase activity
MKGSQSPSNVQNVGDPPQTTRIYLPGLPEWVHLALERAGYDAETLPYATQAELEAVDGIGKATARMIRKAFEEWAEA